MNPQLADPEFWVEVNGSDILQQIAELEAIAEPTKAQMRKLANARIALSRVKEEAIELAKANAKWQAGTEGKVNPQVYLTDEDEWAKDLLVDTPAPAKGELCHYCGGPVDYITGTQGATAPRFTRVADVRKVGDELVLEEKVKVTVKHITACPKCCDKVKKPVIVTRV